MCIKEYSLVSVYSDIFYRFLVDFQLKIRLRSEVENFGQPARVANRSPAWAVDTDLLVRQA